jgi:hypothetical protein
MGDRSWHPRRTSADALEGSLRRVVAIAPDSQGDRGCPPCRTTGLPAVSTVSLILRKQGLVDPKRRVSRDPDLRGPTGPHRPERAPNEQLTVDFKGHFRLGGRLIHRPLAVHDDAMRYVRYE